MILPLNLVFSDSSIQNRTVRRRDREVKNATCKCSFSSSSRFQYFWLALLRATFSRIANKMLGSNWYQGTMLCSVLSGKLSTEAEFGQSKFF